MPNTATVSCTATRAAHDVVNDKACTLGEDSTAIVQQTSGLLAASAYSTASPIYSLSRPAFAAQHAEMPPAAATAGQNSGAAGLGALLATIDELEGDRAPDASAAATLAAMGCASATDQAAVSSSEKTGRAPFGAALCLSLPGLCQGAFANNSAVC